MSPDLRAALDAVYASFSSVGRPARIDACDHCGDDYSHLLETDRLALSVDSVSKYVGSVFYTCGSEIDFHYLFPRLLELLLVDDGLMPEILLGKLQHAHWKRWPDDQQRSIEIVVQKGLVQLCDTSEPFGSDIDAMLCGAFLAGMDLTVLLKTVAQHPKATAALYFTNLDGTADIRPRNAFASAGYADVLTAFLTAPPAAGHIAEAWAELGAGGK
jgi:hypothetical protein